MEKIEKILVELNDVLVSMPNEHLDCELEDLAQYQFLNEILVQKNDPLWEQAVLCVTAQLYDLDMSGCIPEADNIKYELRDFDETLFLVNYYLGISEDDYSYFEKDGFHYLASSKEKIGMDTICKMLSIVIENRLTSLINYIFGQLLKVPLLDWLKLYDYLDEDGELEYEMSEIEDFIFNLNSTIDSEFELETLNQ